MKQMLWSLPGFSLTLDRLFAPCKDAVKAPTTGQWENVKKRLASDVGFYDLPLSVSEEELHSLESLASQFRKSASGALIAGIGGSYLGAATVVQALQSDEEAESFPLYWLVNVDGSAIRAAKRFLSQRKAPAIFISKSGGTTETLSALIHLSHHISAKQIVAITDPKIGELRRLATENGWHAFPVPPKIGGRFTVLTAVGLFPALLAGLDARLLLQGASQMRAALESFPTNENPAAWLAVLLHHWDRERSHRMQYLMPYHSRLEKLSDWYVQLWGESLGKKGPNGESVGPTPGAAQGTSDQHSLLQLFKEGPRDKVVGFVDVAPAPGATTVGKPSVSLQGMDFLYPHTFDHITRTASFATEQSLTNSGVPTYRLSLPRLDASSLGALFFFFETACAYAGELYGVDAFNQPGVEESKLLLKAALNTPSHTL